MNQAVRTILGAVSILLGLTVLVLQITGELVLSLCLLSCPGTKISSEFIPVELMLLVGLLGGVLLSGGLWTMKTPKSSGTGNVTMGGAMLVLGILVASAGIIFSAFLYLGISLPTYTPAIAAETEIAYSTGTVSALLIVTGIWAVSKKKEHFLDLSPLPSH